jgi:DME family drug/metabolite transporter
VSAALLAGTGGPAGALLEALTGLGPLAVADYRLVVGGLAMLGVPLARRRLGRPRRAGLIRVSSVAVLAAGCQYCYFASVSATSVGVATLATLGVAPVLMLGAESVHRRARPPAAASGAAGLAGLGLGLLAGDPGGIPSLAEGLLFALGAAAAFGALTLLGRRPVPGLDEALILGAGFTLAGVLLALPAALVGGLAFAPSPAALGVLAYFGLVPTALAYRLFFLGLRGVPASCAAVLAVLELVAATVLGVLVLGERLDAIAALGAGVLCAAALLASTGPRR